MNTEKFDPSDAATEQERLSTRVVARRRRRPALIVAASALEEQHSFSFGTSIIEAARRAGAERLVSKELQRRAAESPPWSSPTRSGPRRSSAGPRDQGTAPPTSACADARARRHRPAAPDGADRGAGLRLRHGRPARSCRSSPRGSGRAAVAADVVGWLAEPHRDVLDPGPHLLGAEGHRARHADLPARIFRLPTGISATPDRDRGAGPPRPGDGWPPG